MVDESEERSGRCRHIRVSIGDDLDIHLAGALVYGGGRSEEESIHRPALSTRNCIARARVLRSPP